MTIKKIGNALYIEGDDAVQDAVFYSNLLKSPEVGITARQMKAILEGKSVSIKILTEVNVEKKNGSAI
jgi:hypothetical protein